jgi:hypothetical protein
VTIPEVLSQLRQVKEHLDRAKAAIQQAMSELGKAEALLHYTLGNIKDKSIYALLAQAKQRLTEAAQAADLTSSKTDEWIRKIHGTAGPGNP